MAEILFQAQEEKLHYRGMGENIITLIVLLSVNECC